VKGETLQGLVAGLGAFGDRSALGLRSTNGARWWSYRRLEEETQRFAGMLRARGLGPGDHVVLWAANCPEWGAAALGSMLRGCVVVPIDEQASAERAQTIVRLADARLVVHGAEQDVAVLDLPAVPLLEATEDAPAHSAPVPLDPDAPAFLLFTSGSTRAPRGVAITHGNLVSQLEAFRRWRRLARLRAFRLLALSPLSHVQGLVIGLIAPLSLGVSVLYSTSVEAPQLIRTIRQNRIHLLLAVPRVQAMLADTLRSDVSGRHGQTLRERTAGMRSFLHRRHTLFLATRRRLGYSFGVLLVGGAVLDSDDERFWFEAGYLLAQGYGLTETTALVSIHLNNPLGARLGSVGRALPNQVVHVAADGEVLVRGLNVAPGAALGDGYLHTGDMGRIDRRGRLWLQGRKDDVIVSAEGLNVHAADVEQRLRAVGVRDAVVADRDHRGQVHAVLLVDDGVKPEELVASANRLLEPHQRVHSWSVWPGEDFPRTSLSKVRRGEVIGPLVAPSEPPIAADGVPDLQAVRVEGDRRRRLELLARYVASEIALSEPEGGIRIEDLGLSSLDVVELVTLIESARRRPLPLLAVMPSTTIAELRESAAYDGRGPTHAALPQRQPRWSTALPGRALRVLTRPVIVGSWAHLSTGITVEHPKRWPRGPCILAVAPHRHWLDAFAVQAALPRNRPVATVTNRDFAEYFAPSRDVPLHTRLQVGLAYHALWPAVFEFVIVPNYGSTREGLQELGRAIDRGLSAISFPKGLAPPGRPNPRHETGVAQLAIDTETPVVPVWLEGNDGLGLLPGRRRPQVTVRFGAAIRVRPQTSPAELVGQVEVAYDRLSHGTASAR
jgi:long-chain acyl-CoA synthetase